MRKLAATLGPAAKSRRENFRQRQERERVARSWAIAPNSDGVVMNVDELLKSIEAAKLKAFCGRDEDTPCGLKDARECRTHHAIQLGDAEMREIRTQWSRLR